ncbi:MAG: VWA domain-containing protein [Pontiellaceae bacterium]|nr:VWA domain-containing protein [Pontiellaceae bacterium]
MSFSNPFWLLFAVPAGLLFWLFRQRRRSLNIWRGTLLTILLLALADLSVTLPKPGGLVVVIADRSASLPDNADATQKEIISRLQRNMRADHQLAVVAVGENSTVELAPQQGGFNGFAAAVGPDQSRLSEALEQGLSLIPEKTPGRILLLSDGHWTGTHPAAAAQHAALRDIPIDYRVIQRPEQRDLSIRSISAPQSVGKGQSFLIHAWLDAPNDQTVEYILTRNGDPIASGDKELVQGTNRIVFRDRTANPGTAAYELLIRTAEDDPLPQNNRARFMVGVGGELPMLCISRTPSSALGQLLSGAGINVLTLAPEQMDWSVENLSRYSGIILENIAADEIGMSGLELLAAWVETSGRGLMVTGGKRSYGAGGYFKSPLERILPVSMELRREHRKLSLAIAVVLDRSGSMGAPVSGGKTKMDLANVGTVQVLDLLSDMDEMGVLAVDSKPHTILDMKPVEQCRARRDDILQIESMGGGIYVYEGLLAASKMLLKAKAGTRHIILFSDAADSEEPGKYKELLDTREDANITVSVVALGSPSDSDADLLRDIAKRGGGEIYFTQDATEVPRIFAQDTFAVARSTFLEDPVRIQWTPIMPLLTGGSSFSEAPALGGYNLCYLREGAQMPAVSTDEYAAPIIAEWQAGAGRVLCYTGEADGEFTGGIAGWSDYGSFLAGLARWTAGEYSPLPDEAILVQEIENGICRISLHLDPDRTQEVFSGTPLVNVLHSIPRQPLVKETLEMQWESADLLTAEIPLNGIETMAASVSIKGFSPVAMPPVCLAYSPEYETKDPGTGLNALKNLSTISDGRERIDIGNIWKELPMPWKQRSLRPFLLLLAVVLFFLEIIDRRIGLRLSQRPKTKEKPAPKNPRNKIKRTPQKPKPAATQPAPPAPKEAEPESALKAARAKANRRFKR